MTETLAPVASLVTVGNELLYGQTVDTNAAWLGRSLALLGFRVARTFTVGDDPGSIQTAVGSAMEDADLVLVSGGLGPTPDDLTKAAVAQLLGREIGLDEELLEKLAVRFRAAGYDRLPAPNRSQAEVPEGAIVMHNPQGTAPGLGLETDSCLVVMLPGVPRELRAIFEGDLADLLCGRFAERLEPVQHRTIHTTGVPESRLITVQVWDKSQVPAVEKAIRESDLGLNPVNDGKLLRISIPQLTEERRKELVKKVKVGDKVVTNGGIHGKIAAVKEHTVFLKITDNVKIEINRSSIGEITLADKASADTLNSAPTKKRGVLGSSKA